MIEAAAKLVLGGYNPLLELVHTAARAGIGIFFANSGWHKLFTPHRRTKLRRTLIDDGVPYVEFNMWLVPIAELIAGAFLAIGFLAIPSTITLIIICLVATCVDGIKRIPRWNPLNKLDWFGDLLYLPETLYILLLLYVISAGAGRWSVDAYLLSLL